MGINRSPGCGCCGCPISEFTELSPYGHAAVGTETLAITMLPTFQTNKRYYFQDHNGVAGDPFGGWFVNSSSDRSVFMEFVSEDESTVYDSITWKAHDEWEKHEIACDETTYLGGGWGFETSGGTKISLRTEEETMPNNSTVVRIASITSSDPSVDDWKLSRGSNPDCTVQAFPIGEADPPCETGAGPTCPCADQLSNEKMKYYMEHDVWAVDAANPSIPVFNHYRVYSLTYDEDGCSACSGSTTPYVRHMINNNDGFTVIRNVDYADGDQSKTTDSGLTVGSGGASDGDTAWVYMNPECPSASVSTGWSTTQVNAKTISNTTDSSMGFKIWQSNVRTLSGNTVTLQLWRDYGAYPADVTVSGGTGPDQTISFAAGELLKEFTITAPTATESYSEPPTGYVTNTSTDIWHSMVVKSDVIEFTCWAENDIPTSDGYAHGKARLDAKFIPIDRSSWSDLPFKIRMTKSGNPSVSMYHGKYAVQDIQRPKLDCYEPENLKCDPIQECDAKNELHIQPLTSSGLSGTGSEAFPQEVETSVAGCTTSTLYAPDQPGNQILSYYGYVTVDEFHRHARYYFDADTLETGNVVRVPKRTDVGTQPSSVDWDSITAFSFTCSNTGVGYSYKNAFVHLNPPVDYYHNGDWAGNIRGAILDFNGCGSSPLQWTNSVYFNDTEAMHKLVWEDNVYGPFAQKPPFGYGRDGWLRYSPDLTVYSVSSKITTNTPCDGDDPPSVTMSDDGVSGILTQATVVSTTKTSLWPPDIDLPDDPVGIKYETTGPLKGLLFDETATGYEYAGQVELAVHTDRSDLSKFSSNGLLTLLASSTLWIQIEGSDDPAEDGYYQLQNVGGSLEVDVATLTQTEPTLTVRKIGVQGSITCSHTTHEFMEEGFDWENDYRIVEEPPAVGPNVSYKHSVRKWKYDQTDYEWDESVPIYEEGDDYDYDANIYVNHIDVSGGVKQFRPDKSEYKHFLFCSDITSPGSTVDDQFYTDNADKIPAEPGSPSDYFHSIPDETDRIFEDKTNGPWTYETFDVYHYDKDGIFGMLWGIAECCNNEDVNPGNNTVSYCDLSNQPNFDPVLTRWLDNYPDELDTITERTCSIGHTDDIDSPFAGIITGSTTVNYKIKWFDCWEGMPDSLSTSFGPADLVSNQPTIYALKKIQTGEIGGLNEEPYVEVDMEFTEIDLSSISFNVSGDSW